MLKTYDAAPKNKFIFSKHVLLGVLTKNAIISLRPVPAQANLYLMVNNNKTLILVVFTFVLEEFELVKGTELFDYN